MTDMHDKMASILQNAIASVDRKLQNSRSDVDSAPSSLMAAWLETNSSPAFPVKPVPRAPASSATIDACEARLRCKLPDQVRELYQSMDGLDWIPSAGDPMEFGGHFPPLASLSIAGELAPPLSVRLAAYWKEFAEDEEPAAVEVFGPGAISHMVEEPELVLPFEVLDRFLALQEPPSESCILIAHDASLPLQYGEVLELEGLLATRYQSLSHWLSASTSLLAPGT